MAASNLANQTMRSLLDQIYTHACSEQKKSIPGETTVSIEVIFSDETRVTYTGLYPSREVIYLTAVSTDSTLLGDVNTVIQAEADIAKSATRVDEDLPTPIGETTDKTSDGNPQMFALQESMVFNDDVYRQVLEAFPYVIGKLYEDMCLSTVEQKLCARLGVVQAEISNYLDLMVKRGILIRSTGTVGKTVHISQLFTAFYYRFFSALPIMFPALDSVVLEKDLYQVARANASLYTAGPKWHDVMLNDYIAVVLGYLTCNNMMTRQRDLDGTIYTWRRPNYDTTVGLSHV